MTNDRRRIVRTRAAADPISVRALAEAGAKGRPLSPAEMIAVCEALRAQTARTPNQFHSGM